MKKLPALGLLLLAALRLSDARADDPWQREIMPLIWSSSLSGHQSQGNVSVDVAGSDVSELGASLRFTARRDPVWAYQPAPELVEPRALSAFVCDRCSFASPIPRRIGACPTGQLNRTIRARAGEG